MAESQLAHSHSSLELFNDCPKKFYHLRVAKDYKEEENQWSIAGTRDHKYLELRLKDGTPLPPHLLKHEDKCATILNSGMIVKPEEELAVTREFKPCGWWQKDVFLRAKVDVGLYRATHAALLDWKTGKRKPKPFQLELGTLLQFAHYPQIKSTKAAFLWLKDDASDPYTYTREKDHDRIMTKLMEKVEKVEEAEALGIWQAKPSEFKCTYCPVKNDCSYSQARK